MKLSISIAFVVTFLALLVALITSFYSYHATLQIERDKAQISISQLGNTVLRTAMIAGYLDNKEIANDVIQGLTSNEIVDSVMLTSVTGMQVYNNIKMLDSQENASAVTIELESPFMSGEFVGKLLILPKHSLIEKNARAIAMDKALLLAGNTLVIALLIMLVIQCMFVTVLKQMA